MGGAEHDLSVDTVKCLQLLKAWVMLQQVNTHILRKGPL